MRILTEPTLKDRLANQLEKRRQLQEIERQKEQAAAERERLKSILFAPFLAVYGLLARERPASIDCRRFKTKGAERRAAAMRRR